MYTTNIVFIIIANPPIYRLSYVFLCPRRRFTFNCHVNSIHEFTSVVGPPRHECDFGLFFNDDWTPSHLTGGPTNLYKEIAFALKGTEWRQPGLVAVASKLASSVDKHKPINVKVPSTYEPAKGPNLWTSSVGKHKPINVKVPSTYAPAKGPNLSVGDSSSKHDKNEASEMGELLKQLSPRLEGVYPAGAGADSNTAGSWTSELSDRIRNIMISTAANLSPKVADVEQQPSPEIGRGNLQA